MPFTTLTVSFIFKKHKLHCKFMCYVSTAKLFAIEPITQFLIRLHNHVVLEGLIRTLQLKPINEN